MKKDTIELIHSVMQGVTFYKDKHNREALFAEFRNGANVKHFSRLESAEFKAYVVMKSLELTDEEQSLNGDATVQYLRNYFTYYGNPTAVDVYVRTAGDLEHGIEYDLKDEEQHSVRISPQGWKIAQKKKHKFLSSSTALPQVLPQSSDEDLLKLLKPFVNIHGNQYKLFVIWLVQAFCSGKHSALLVRAPRGSGKSSLSRTIRALLAPSEVDISNFSNNRSDFICTLANLYLVCYDNVRTISVEQSDILCQAITGVTVPSRTLYTNNDLFVQKLRNIVIVNGIQVLPTESDLAERFLVVNLQKIDESKRKREKDLQRAFDAKRPLILGAIFETLKKAMQCYSSISIENMPRMADSFFDMLVIALALGLTEEEFRAIYAENVAEMDRLRNETPFVRAVRELMDANPGRRSIDGTAEEICAMVQRHYSGDVSDLPGDGSHFTRKADKEHDTLAAAGLRINVDDTYQRATRVKIIRKKK